MKVLPFKIPKPENATLVVQEDKADKLYDKLHQHQEIQISLIKKGEGSCIIGDHVGEFRKGDIFVIGENLPHVFHNDPLEGGVHMISLFFMRSTYGDQFFSLPEFKSLDRIFKTSSLGFKLKGEHQELINAIEKLPSRSELKRFITFLEILDKI